LAVLNVISLEEYRDIVKPKKKNKYQAKRTYSELCQRTFASKKEARRGEELALMEREGLISGLEFQPRYPLSKDPRVTYTADFRYTENGKTIIEDAKGFLTEATRIKLAWVKEKYNIEIKLV
jgi:ribonuclease BN (tRNA processing enzyme)